MKLLLVCIVVLATGMAVCLIGCGDTTTKGEIVQGSKANEHALIVKYEYGKTDLSDLHALEDVLEDAIAKAKVGEFDGHEIAIDGSEVVLYMYAPDVDKLHATVEPLLRANPSVKKPKYTLRYGPPQEGVRSVEK